MLTFILLLIYLFFCFLVAYAGRDALIGFFGIFAVSIFFTPLVAAILVVLFGPAHKGKERINGLKR